MTTSVATTTKRGLTKKEELHQLEAEIKEDMEHVFRVGERLERIKERRLYEADGFTDFTAYCNARFELSRRRAYAFITAFGFRKLLPRVPNGHSPWKERQVREFDRVEKHLAAKNPRWDDGKARAESLKKIPSIGRRILNKITGKEPFTLTAGTVRQCIDEELNIKPKPKKRPRTAAEKEDDQPMIDDYLNECSIMVASTLSTIKKAMSDDVGRLLMKRDPHLVTRLTTGCEKLAAFLKEVCHVGERRR